MPWSEEVQKCGPSTLRVGGQALPTRSYVLIWICRGIKSYSSPMRKAAKPPPPMQKLSEIWYSNLTDAKLRKKLQELGLNHDGKRELLIKRSQEWRNRWNANLDAPEEERKTKVQLLEDLYAWERAHKRNALTAEAPVMQKDYDLQTHARANKSQFDELIAAARAKARTKATEVKETPVPDGNDKIEETPSKYSQEGVCTNSDMSTRHGSDANRPYDSNHKTLATIRPKVQETNDNGTIQAPDAQHEPSASQHIAQTDSPSVGISNPFGSPSRKLPMFAAREDPILDVESSASTS